MRDKLILHVKHLFFSIPNSDEMQQEILQNSLDRYDDLISQGKSPEAAYQLAISGLGDLKELGVPTTKKKKPIWPIFLVIGLILGLILLLCLIPRAPAEDPAPTSPTSSTPPTYPTDPANPTIPSTTTYTISCANSLSLSFLVEPLPTNATAGSIVTLKTYALTDVDLALYVDGEFISHQYTVDDENGTHWEFSFIMPGHNVVIQFKTVSNPDPDDIYQYAESLIIEGRLAEAAITFGKIEYYHDAKERCCALWENVRNHTTVVSVGNMLLGVQSDGCIITTDNSHELYPEVENWENIRAIAAGDGHIIGLREDGTVVAAGANSYGQCNVSQWNDIVSIDCGSNFTIGLKADGTVLLTGNPISGVEAWSNIAMIEAAGNNVLAIQRDGTALIAGTLAQTQNIDFPLSDTIDIHLDTDRAIFLHFDGIFHILGEPHYAQEMQIPGLLTIESDGHYLAGQMIDGNWFFKGYGISLEISETIVTIIDYCNRKLGLTLDGTIVLLGFYSESTVQTPCWNHIKT